MDSQKTRRGIGLALLPETLRFIITVTAIFLLSFSNRWVSGIWPLLVSVILLLLNLQVQRPKILGFLVLTTFGVLLAGNWLFSPSYCGGKNWFLFTINDCGLNNGLENAYTRTAMLIVGWAWFEATGILPAERLLTKILALTIGKKNAERYIASAFALASRSYNEYRLATINAELLFPTGLWLGLGNGIKRKFLISKTILQSCIRRIFDWSGELLLVNDGQLSDGCGSFRTPCSDSLMVSALSVWNDDDDSAPLLQDFSLSVYPGGITKLDLPEIEASLVIKALSGEIPYILGRVSGNISYGNRLLLAPNNDPLGTIKGRAAYFYLVQSSPNKNFSCLTVRDHIHRRSQNEEVASDYSNRFSIAHLMDRSPFTLSGGQQMRVAIAAALASDAPILLLDSPYSELDVDGRNELDKCLSEVATQTNKIVILNDSSRKAQYRFATKTKRLQLAKVRHGNNPILHIQECFVSINGSDILKNVSISINVGEFILLTGPNGSGKSTLLRLLAGHEKMRKGKRYCGGIVSFVFQDIGMQIVEDKPALQLTYGQRMNPQCKSPLLQANKSTNKFFMASDTSSMPDSSKRVLAIRSAEMADVILLDEPTKEMDHMQSIRLRRRLMALCRYGKTVVVATHDPQYFDGLGRHYHISSGLLVPHSSER